MSGPSRKRIPVTAFRGTRCPARAASPRRPDWESEDTTSYGHPETEERTAASRAAGGGCILVVKRLAVPAGPRSSGIRDAESAVKPDEDRSAGIRHVLNGAGRDTDRSLRLVG
jgi:hypothetical protein